MVKKRIVRLIGWVAASALLVLFLGADQAAEESNTLDPQSHAKMLMALLGILLLGMILMVMVVVGAHRVRRLARARPGASQMQEDTWYSKPLDESNEEESVQDAPHKEDPDEDNRAEREN